MSRDSNPWPTRVRWSVCLAARWNIWNHAFGIDWNSVGRLVQRNFIFEMDSSSPGGRRLWPSISPRAASSLKNISSISLLSPSDRPRFQWKSEKSWTNETSNVKIWCSRSTSSNCLLAFCVSMDPIQWLSSSAFSWIFPGVTIELVTRVFHPLLWAEVRRRGL